MSFVPIVSPDGDFAQANILLYFESLSTNGRLATMLINSSLAALFASLLRTTAATTLKVRLATLFGLLLRHTTYVHAKLARGVLPFCLRWHLVRVQSQVKYFDFLRRAGDLLITLAGLVRDRSEKVRRRASAALGELLFYIAIQQQQQRPDKPLTQPPVQQRFSRSRLETGAPDDAEWSQPWKVPQAVPQVVFNALSSSEDVVVAHYVAKALENIFAASVSRPRRMLRILGSARVVHPSCACDAVHYSVPYERAAFQSS